MSTLSGTLKKAGGGALKRDQDRWFVLVGDQLEYYKAKSEEKLGCIDLKGTVVGGEVRRMAVHIEGGGLSKGYTLFASTEEEYAKWVDAISKAANPAEKGVGVEDFEVIRVIGKGGFGNVVKVERKADHKVFAMKVMQKAAIIRENLIEYTQAERDVLSSVNHPFIVKLHHAFQTEDRLYLVLDYLSGGELFFHLSQTASGSFPEPQAMFYTAQIALAISYLHENNIIYRDLKPENCVLDSKGNCCITDFGLAKALQGDEADTFCGTPAYLAPEFMMGGSHGCAVDWWSLGVLHYEMVVGMVPFYSSNLNEMYELILTGEVSFEPGAMSEPGQDLCKRLLHRDADSRMQTRKEFTTHPCYAEYDFEALEGGKVEAPFKPDPEVNYGEGGGERSVHSVVKKVPHLAAQQHFGNFAYNACEEK